MQKKTGRRHIRRGARVWLPSSQQQRREYAVERERAFEAARYGQKCSSCAEVLSCAAPVCAKVVKLTKEEREFAVQRDVCKSVNK